MARTLILDLDGTLIDSAADLAAALNRLMLSRRLAPFSRAEVVAMIGDGVEALVTRGLGGRGQEPDPAAVTAFRADYSRHTTDNSQPYPGTADTLRQLSTEGWRLAVCTNKPEADARVILIALALDGLIDSVTGGDGPRKPDPAHILAAMAAAGGTADRTVTVGDHRNDVLAARAAGIPTIFAAWGYGSTSMAAGATATAASIKDVPAIASRLCPA